MVKQYEKPVVVVNEDLAEGVYASSGAFGAKKCDSIYYNGVYHPTDFSAWTTERSYSDQFGCHGCPAYTPEGCGLASHKPESGDAASYDTDNGNRKPLWEQKGYAPGDTVTDWSC